jgi:hypothetical protein
MAVALSELFSIQIKMPGAEKSAHLPPKPWLVEPGQKVTVDKNEYGLLAFGDLQIPSHSPTDWKPNKQFVLFCESPFNFVHNTQNEVPVLQRQVEFALVIHPNGPAEIFRLPRQTKLIAAEIVEKYNQDRRVNALPEEKLTRLLGTLKSDNGAEKTAKPLPPTPPGLWEKIIR